MNIEVENHQESRPEVHFLLFQDTVSSFFCVLMRKYSLQADILVRGYYGWNSRRALQVLTEVFPKVLYYFIGQINGSLLLIDVVVCGLTCFMAVKYSFFGSFCILILYEKPC